MAAGGAGVSFGGAVSREGNTLHIGLGWLYWGLDQGVPELSDWGGRAVGGGVAL